MANDRRNCFVIGPIGAPDSDERTNADWVLDYILKPVLEDEKFNFDVDRADKGDPGLITDQLIISIKEADLIIADLTGQNPNVFYELGIAHSLKKPIIHLITDGEILPFDIRDYRGVFYNRDTVRGIEEAKAQLGEQIEATDRDGYKPSNPVSRALGHFDLLQTGDSRDQIIADQGAQIQSMQHLLKLLSSKVTEIAHSIGDVTISPPTGKLGTGLLGSMGLGVAKSGGLETVLTPPRAAPLKRRGLLSEPSAPDRLEQSGEEVLRTSAVAAEPGDDEG